MNSYKDIWGQVLDLLRKKLTSVAISTWFEDCRILDIDDTTLVVHVPSNFKKNILDQRFIPDIKEAMHEIFASDFDVILLGEGEDVKYDRNARRDGGRFDADDYTFDNFVVGASNKFAHAAAKAVATGDGYKGYNPLFIYGNSGLGKTHLLYAIRHEVRLRHPEYNIVYIKGDDFTNDLVAAIQSGKNLEFREKYRNADLFLMDDVQFIAGRESSQEEMFHTFNTLYENGKQIVFTADRPPNEMLKLDDRLRTRFSSGLPIDILPPDYETRVAIIRQKVDMLGIWLDEDSIEYIAEKISYNVRQIEGVTNKIRAQHDLMGGKIDMKMVEDTIRELYNSYSEAVPTPGLIIEECAKYFSLTQEDILGKNQSKNPVLGRQIGMYLTRKLTGLSLSEIGAAFGNRDHTTVISSLRKIEKRAATDKEFNQMIKDVTANINCRL